MLLCCPKNPDWIQSLDYQCNKFHRVTLLALCISENNSSNVQDVLRIPRHFYSIVT
jgi:hypothetical protein